MWRQESRCNGARRVTVVGYLAKTNRKVPDSARPLLLSVPFFFLITRWSSLSFNRLNFPKMAQNVGRSSPWEARPPREYSFFLCHAMQKRSFDLMSIVRRSSHVHRLHDSPRVNTQQRPSCPGCSRLVTGNLPCLRRDRQLKPLSTSMGTAPARAMFTRKLSELFLFYPASTQQACY